MEKVRHGVTHHHFLIPRGAVAGPESFKSSPEANDGWRNYRRTYLPVRLQYYFSFLSDLLEWRRSRGVSKEGVPWWLGRAVFLVKFLYWAMASLAYCFCFCLECSKKPVMGDFSISCDDDETTCLITLVVCCCFCFQVVTSIDNYRALASTAVYQYVLNYVCRAWREESNKRSNRQQQAVIRPLFVFVGL